MVIGSTADFDMNLTADASAFERAMEQIERAIARFMLIEEVRFLGPPQCEPLSIFEEPQPIIVEAK